MGGDSIHPYIWCVPYVTEPQYDLIIHSGNFNRGFWFAEPLFSKFSDIWGRKAILLFGTSIFLLGSVISGAATVSVWACSFMQWSTNIDRKMLEHYHVDCVQSDFRYWRLSYFVHGREYDPAYENLVWHHTDSFHQIWQVFVIISELVPLEQRGKYQGSVDKYKLFYDTKYDPYNTFLFSVSSMPCSQCPVSAVLWSVAVSLIVSLGDGAFILSMLFPLARE